jgi:glycosyltransferase involved in cell wall biosynthesis
MYVSVVMPTHNRQGYVGQAIESVLKQQHVEFELIIVDDASTDGTLDVIDRYARQDHRIRVAQHAENKGLAVSLNEGLDLAKHDLIARMDDDDVMFPTRLQRQIEFMDANQDVSVTSSWAYLIDESSRIIGRSCPEVDLERGKAQLRPELFLELIHPATMYRRGDILKVGGYKIKVGGYKITALEDRDLWGRLVTAGYKIAVQPELLMYQRRHSHSLTTTDLKKLFEFGDFIDFNVVRRLCGGDELTFEQYGSYVESLPFSMRLAGTIKQRSGIAFRRATMYYSTRDWLPLAGNLALAMALEPLGTAKRIRKKFTSIKAKSESANAEQPFFGF